MKNNFWRNFNKELTETKTGLCSTWDSPVIKKIRDIVKWHFSKNRPSWPNQSISWNVRICGCLSVRHTLSHSVKRFFCPHFLKSNVQTFFLLLFLESLGKSKGKKWSQIWKLLLIKGLKLLLQKKFYGFCFIFSLCLNIFWSPPPKVKCPHFLDFLNSWGKVMERNAVRFENFCSWRVKNCCAKKVFSLLKILPY